ncbi:MAG: redoxin domain-containing protein [Candidatus Brocadia sinica]|nr:redoxin domain-containing protein [Candidatus Brocadia sinica]
MPVRVGDPAPDFQVKDDAGRMRTLSEFRGKKVVLYFYPIILLSDEKKEVAEAYGASGGLLGSLMAKRYTYLIDEHGKIVHIFKKVDVKNHAAEVLQAFSEHSKK